MLVQIAETDDPAQARVLIAALKAHGFHPMEADSDGLPGWPGVFGPRGLPILVPEEEKDAAGTLAQDLLAQMADRSS